jgi:two-component system, NtrC family, response regulator PilR
MENSAITVLIVDDEEDIRATLEEYIGRMGLTVRTEPDFPSAQARLAEEPEPFDIVITDLRIPGGSGLDVVRAAHSRNPETLVSIMTGFASLETAIGAVRLGAYDYFTKPFNLGEIGIQIRNMTGRVALSKENARLSLRLQDLYAQVSRFQDERLAMLRFQDELRRELQQNSQKLDRLLSTSIPSQCN